MSNRFSCRALAATLLALGLSGGVLAQPTQVPPNPKPPEVDYRLDWFDIPVGNQDNRFFKTQDVAVHLMTSSHPSRIVAAFPGGNSGAGLWFAEDAHFEMAGPQATGGNDFQQVEVAVRSNQHSLRLKRVIMDNLRMLRDDALSHQAALIRSEYAKAHNLPAGSGNNTFRSQMIVNEMHLIFERKDFGVASPYQVEIILPPDTKVENDVNGARLTCVEDLLAFRVRIRVPYPALHPVPDEQLFTPKFLQFWREHRQSAPQAVRDALRNFKFLAFREKLVAGSWTYLTYFGRDTAVTLSLLDPILSSQALQNGLQSLLDRVSSGGKVAHEEEVGSLDEIDRLREQQAPDAAARPHLDHKMIDSDYFLPIVWADYVHKAKANDVGVFLSQNNLRGEANHQTLMRNFRRIIGQARRFASAPSATNLVSLEPGVPVGNWRDSNTGIGNGRFPVDVNLWLMPAALDAIAGSSQRFHGQVPSRSEIAALSAAWRGARKYFMVHLSAAQMRERVKAFLADPDRASERAALRAQPIEPGFTVGDFLDGHTPASLADGIRFPAISLDGHGKPIPIMCSDEVFGLYFDRLTATEVHDLLPAFRLPFPLGLRTPVGLLTANPAYDPDPARRALFKSWAYHGTVVWVWPQAMLELGLSRQLHLHGGELHAELASLLAEYQSARSHLGSLALAELYGYHTEGTHFAANPYGVGGPAPNEANPIQLWSSVLPALYYVEAHSSKESFSARRTRPLARKE